MSGIAIAVATGVTPSAPPPAPLAAYLTWGGSDNFSVAGASGSSADMGVYNAALGGYLYNYYFLIGSSGGIDPVTSDGLNVSYNPSGKLGIAAWSASGFWLTWSGLAINEIELMTVSHTATDGAGASDTRNITLAVKRTS